MRSVSEAGSYLRRIDFVYHSTLGLRVIEEKEEKWQKQSCATRTCPLDPKPIFVLYYCEAYSRVIQRSMRLKYEPASKPLHISVKELSSNLKP